MEEMLLTIVHLIVAIFMILVVLIQGGNQGGVGAAFGGGNSSGVFGATGATSLLGKITYGAAFVFMMTSIRLSIIQGAGVEDPTRELLKQRAAESATTEGAKEEPAAADATPDGASK